MRRFLSYGLLAGVLALGAVEPSASASPGGPCAGLADTNCYYDSGDGRHWCGVWAAATCIQPAFTISPEAVAVAGSGTINPGLVCPASGCTVHVDFLALFVGPGTTASCTFDGTDRLPGGATLLAGSGSGTINCSGGASASGTVTFTRELGAVVNVGGLIALNSSSCWVAVTLAFVPTSPPPVTTFAVAGGGTVTC